MIVSIGLGNSVLNAHLATNMAKPDGILYLNNDTLLDHINHKNVTIIP